MGLPNLFAVQFLGKVTTVFLALLCMLPHHHGTVKAQEDPPCIICPVDEMANPDGIIFVLGTTVTCAQVQYSASAALCPFYQGYASFCGCPEVIDGPTTIAGLVWIALDVVEGEMPPDIIALYEQFANVVATAGLTAEGVTDVATSLVEQEVVENPSGRRLLLLRRQLQEGLVRLLTAVEISGTITEESTVQDSEALSNIVVTLFNENSAIIVTQLVVQDEFFQNVTHAIADTEPNALRGPTPAPTPPPTTRDRPLLAILMLLRRIFGGDGGGGDGDGED